MLEENKKKIAICAIIGIMIVILGIIFYKIQNNEQEYIDFDEIEQKEINNENYGNNEDRENNEENENSKERKSEEKNIVVHIAGEVLNPGVITLKEGARIIDAINQAGGITKKADISKINLAYILSDAQKIYIPSVDEKEDVNYITESAKQETKGYEVKEGEKIMININTASKQELQKVPGIGEIIAERIVEYRKTNGKFSKVEDIQNVSGIGSSKYAKIKEYICVK